MEDYPTHLPEAVEDEVVRFVEKEGQRRWALEILEDSDRGKTVKVERTLNRLRNLSSCFGPKIRGHEFSKDTPDYGHHLNATRVSTGMGQVDYALHGGLGGGDLGVLLAPWGAGKTTALVHLGAGAAQSGKRVLHVSLEIPAWQVDCRYIQRLGNITLDEVMRDRKRVASIKSKLKGEVVIRDYSHQRITPEFIEGMVQDDDKGYDLILVDYAALCRSTRNIEGRRFEIGDIFTELRRVASSCNVPIWTAHQATREASKSGDITGNDVSEDISVSQTCDVLICIMKNKWLIDKTRLPREGAERLIRVESDFDHQSYKEVESGPARNSVIAGKKETRQASSVAQKAIRSQSRGSRKKAGS
jgi:replicative DNA helicase